MLEPHQNVQTHPNRREEKYNTLFIVCKIISCWRTFIGIKNSFSIIFSLDTANCKLQSEVTLLQFHFAWILNFRQTFIVYHQL